MVVYVEYVFLDNFIIDLMLIVLTRKSLKLQVKYSLVCLSAVIGGLVAVVTPVLNLPVAISFPLKMPMGLLIVVASGKFKNVKEFIKCFYLFLFFTFLFGGVVTAVFWGLNLSFDPISYANGAKIPLFIILSLVFVTYLFACKIVKEFYKRKTLSSFSINCIVKMGGKSFSFLGFLDSGNSLYYKETDSPIILCANKIGKKLKSEGVLQMPKDVVTISTVSGKSVIPIYKIDKFLIYNGDKTNILYNVMLGVIDGGFSSGEEYDLLLGPLVLEV
ncbi:MAG: sigma-E processing peptidase SpoIIGA [Clostridia bacterium]|nr:sigma-E processing peptidase SpoIIGA [Clostridia bacterium]